MPMPTTCIMATALPQTRPTMAFSTAAAASLHPHGNNNNNAGKNSGGQNIRAQAKVPMPKFPSTATPIVAVAPAANHMVFANSIPLPHKFPAAMAINSNIMCGIGTGTIIWMNGKQQRKPTKKMPIFRQQMIDGTVIMAQATLAAS